MFMTRVKIISALCTTVMFLQCIVYHFKSAELVKSVQSHVTYMRKTQLSDKEVIRPVQDRNHATQTVKSESKNYVDNSAVSFGNISWAQHMDRYCNKLRDRVQTRIVDVSQFRKFLYNDQYKLIYCPIPKIASTNWRRIFLILSGKMNTTDPSQLSSRKVYGSYQVHFNLLNHLNMQQIQYRLKNYLKFIIVREPFERLLSAYRNKLGPDRVTHNKAFNLIYGRHIIKKYRKNPSNKSLKEGHDVKFSEFIKYIIDPERRDSLNRHWKKYHEMCLPCAINYDYIVKYNRINEDSNKIIDKIGASQFVQFPPRSIHYNNKETSKVMYDYYKTLSSRTLRKLYKFYEEDFMLFNYTLPQSISSLTNTSNL